MRRSRADVAPPASIYLMSIVWNDDDLAAPRPRRRYKLTN
jgi:hypothetical protein